MEANSFGNYLRSALHDITQFLELGVNPCVSSFKLNPCCPLPSTKCLEQLVSAVAQMENPCGEQ